MTGMTTDRLVVPQATTALHDGRTLHFQSAHPADGTVLCVWHADDGLIVQGTWIPTFGPDTLHIRLLRTERQPDARDLAAICRVCFAPDARVVLLPYPDANAVLLAESPNEHGDIVADLLASWEGDGDARAVVPSA